MQNSILVWASDHRRHHRHVDDNELDPYSAGRGLWFSHMGWMLRNYNTNEPDFSNARDLQRDPVVMWQHKHYVALTTFMNVGLPLLLGLWHWRYHRHAAAGRAAAPGGQPPRDLFHQLAGPLLGLPALHRDNSARDNGVLAFLTYGEGYHNFHHIFQTDYRNGIRWWQWDPTKWMISLCSRLGLASNLVRVPDFRIQRALLDTQFQRAATNWSSTTAARPCGPRWNANTRCSPSPSTSGRPCRPDATSRKDAELADALEVRGYACSNLGKCRPAHPAERPGVLPEDAAQTTAC